MNNVLYNIFSVCYDILFLLMEPYFFVRTYFVPRGSIFLAYDYVIKQKTVDGKDVVLFAKDLFPHAIYDEKEIALPIKNKLRMAGFNNVYTAYTDKHFFVDQNKNILYLKKMDLAFFGNYCCSSRIEKYVCQKRRVNYAAEALNYLGTLKNKN